MEAIKKLYTKNTELSEKKEAPEMNRYEGKVVLITGAGDVTQATSARLLQEGAKIALLDYS